MPLVHIHLIEDRRDAAAVRRIADVVQEVLREHFAAPPRDRYQLISEHKPGHIIAEDTGLGLERTDDIVLIQIVQQGRTSDQKQATYRALADRLHDECGLAGCRSHRLGRREHAGGLVVRQRRGPVPHRRPLSSVPAVSPTRPR